MLVCSVIAHSSYLDILLHPTVTSHDKPQTVHIFYDLTVHFSGFSIQVFVASARDGRPAAQEVHMLFA